MQIIKVQDRRTLQRRAATIIAAQIIAKPDSVLGLATGSTPVGVYGELAEMYESGLLDFSHITTFNLDEYYRIPRDHPQSYHTYMGENLFNRVNIRPENTHIPDGDAADPQAECSRYEGQIRDAGGIDLQLLGIGRNGHIGFNEPDDHFAPETSLVNLTADTLEANSRFFEAPDQMPRQAISMGTGTIMSARRILLIASGPHKTQALTQALHSPPTPQTPASVLQFHREVTVLYCD